MLNVILRYSFEPFHSCYLYFQLGLLFDKTHFKEIPLVISNTSESDQSALKSARLPFNNC
jgi:hypothetical protein